MAEAIRGGRVKVNDKVVEDFSRPIDTDRDRIRIDERHIELKTPKPFYLVLNKPSGVLTTTRDDRGRKTVLDLLPTKYRQPGLHPIGRLDKDSTGLLLLTNDGDLTQRLAHPRYEHEKEYLVAIGARLGPAEKHRLEQGVELEDGTTHAARVKEVRVKPFTYSITLHEGRKRQVRRMFKRLGYDVLALRRIRVANIILGDLPDGGWRELTPQELNELIPGKMKVSGIKAG
jgi:23S rRNA pseudouridine2605 synthase